MLLLLFLLLVMPAVIGSAAAIGVHLYRRRQTPAPFLPRWVSTTYESPAPEPPGSGKFYDI